MATHRRAVLKGLLLAALPATAKTAAAGLERARKLEEGETALMRGQAEAAMQAFEQAGALGHDPEIELGMVRAAMQAGRYRQALGFAAHTAGEHAQDASCLAAYLWLLRLGGQNDFARQLWSSASPLRWSDADRQLLRSLSDAWAGNWPQAGGPLRRIPLRLAPYAHGQALPAQARVVASGTLVTDAQGAQRVVVPVSVLSGGADQAWWVRNGLGWTVRARTEPSDAADLVGTLRLDATLPGPAALAPRDPFPGSPAHAFAYALAPPPGGLPATDAEAPLALAAWPLMRMGFAGQLHPELGRLLGVDGISGDWSRSEGGFNPLGGPVLDAQGRLTGVAVADGKGPDRLVPASLLAQRGWSPPLAAAGTSGARLTPDALFELGLTAAVQVMHSPLQPAPSAPR